MIQNARKSWKPISKEDILEDNDNKFEHFCLVQQIYHFPYLLQAFKVQFT